MKVKVKLDLAGIKDWLLAHGEKVALALVGIFVLMFIYGAARREVLDTTKHGPDKLKQLADQVGQHVASSQWDPKREAIQQVDYTERAKSKPVEPKAFALVTPLNRPVVDPKGKRGEPEVLGALELRVAAGYDVFQVKGNAGADAKEGDRKLLAQPWAVVTGLVPVLKQQQEHDRVFRDAQGFDEKRDAPRYYMPRLERAEFDPANPEKAEWKGVTSAAKYEAQWGQSSTGEFVARRYLDEDLTGKLGPLANDKQSWGEAVSHPKVPTESEEVARASAAVQAAAPPEKQEAAADENELQSRKAPEGKPQPKVAPGQKPGDEPMEYKLLRVFDYSVEPGRKYRYRVTLLLGNPNYEQQPHLLKNPESARKQALEGKPSEPTTVVAIPTGHKVLAGPVEGGSRYAEPTAKLLVTKIERKEGLEAATELEKVQRGGLANAAPRPVKVKNPLGGGVEEMTLDFQSNIVVLDIYGGRTLGRRRTEPIVSPGEVLVMDADGNVTVRNELDDAAQYESTVVRDEQQPKAGLKEEADAKKPRPGATTRREPPVRLKPEPKRPLKQ